MNTILSDYNTAISNLEAEIAAKQQELTRLLKERDLAVIAEDAKTKAESLTDEARGALVKTITDADEKGSGAKGVKEK